MFTLTQTSKRSNFLSFLTSFNFVFWHIVLRDVIQISFHDVSRKINEEPNVVLIGQIHGDFKVTA